jgi:hypothetical protein
MPETPFKETIMACSEQSFTGLTPAVIGCCVDTANKYGAGIPNPPPASGSVSVHTRVGDFSFRWNFNTTAQTGTIQCTDKPGLIPCFVVTGGVSHAVQECGGKKG